MKRDGPWGDHLGVRLPPALGVGVYRDRRYRRGIA